ncbi:MAG TPA: dihydrodipicolinate synthase family protein [Vicinamibacterales bacterium]|nr:dihydrodipicolinate synthase family protein [Vicinamibacterales bacterium]
MLDAVFPPMCTPFDDSGRIDAAAIGTNVARWVAAGTGGVVALGSNGEAPLLDEAESDEVVAAVRASLPADRTLIAGTGRESTAATIAASRRAAALGASAVLVRTPSYFRSRMTPEALARHYSSVADACPVPVLLYNYPAVTGVNLAPETVGRLSGHPNIAGIKETSSDTAQVAAYVDASTASFTVMAGSAPTAYASLCVGARGAILAAACVVPEQCVALLAAHRRGDHAEARRLQRSITPLARLVTTEYGVPGLKAAMNLAGYAAGDPRLPLLPAPAEAVARIRAELVKLDVLAEVSRVRS